MLSCCPLAARTICVAVLAMVGAQSQSVNWEYRRHAVPYDSLLSVQVPAGTARNYVLGIKSTPSVGDHQSQFVIGEFQFQDSLAAHKIVVGIENLSPEYVRLSKGSLEVLDSGQKDRGLAILGHAVQGTQLTIRAGGVVVFSGAVGPDGIMIAQGSIVGKPVVSMQSVTMHLINGSVRANQDGSPKWLPNGRYFVSLGGLREKLTEFVAPSATIPSLASCCDRVVRVRLEIDQWGQVSKAEPSDKSAGDLVKAALRWRFRPFEVDGAPVLVEGIVPVRIDRLGVVQNVGLR